MNKTRKQSKETLKRIEEAKIRFINNMGEDYILTSDYINAKTHVIVQHNVCGNEYSVRPDNFNTGKRCPYCYQSSKKGSSINRVPKVFLKNIENKYTMETEFKGVRKDIFLRHIQCGTIFKTLPRHFDNSTVNENYGKCPYCYGEFTNGEYKVLKYVNDNDYIYSTQYSFDDCYYKKILKFDFALFNSNYELICLLEFQGEQHYVFNDYFYENKEHFKECVYRDEIKREYCKKNNIPLIEIPYWEINNVNKFLDEKLSQFNYEK